MGDGTTVEVFGASSPFDAHLTSPAVGFLVDDLAAAEQELRAAGTRQPIRTPVSGNEVLAWSAPHDIVSLGSLVLAPG